MTVEQVLINLATGAIGSAGFLFFAGKYFADKSIEYYKKEYQKNLQDYNLYSTQRNIILHNLFKAAVEVLESLPELNGPINHYDFSTFYNEETVLDIFQNVEPCTKEEITGIGYHFKGQKFDELTKMYLRKRVGHYLKIFHNEYMQNLVYLDDELEDNFKKLEKLLNRSHNLMIEKNRTEGKVWEQLNNEDLEKREKTENLLKDIKINIKKLIGI